MTTVMDNLNQMHAEAHALYEHGQIASHLKMLNSILEQHPASAALIHYQMGVSYQTGIGNGNEARRLFLLAIQEAEKLPDEAAALRQEVIANSTENMLLLSENYEEFLEWAEKLHKMHADSPAVQQLQASVQNNQAADDLWQHTMMALAGTYYQQSVGRHGHAAAILDLLVQNRKVLRISGEDYSDILTMYIACIVFITSGHGNKMYHALGYTDPQEFNFILERIKPVVTTYIEGNPEDVRVKNMLSKIEETLNIPPLKKKPASSPGIFVTDHTGKFITQEEPEKETAKPKSVIPWCLGYILLFLGLFGGAYIGKIIGNGRVWAYALGGVVGTIVMIMLMALIEMFGKKRKS